jgi:hypothetical protein
LAVIVSELVGVTEGVTKEGETIGISVEMCIQKVSGVSPGGMGDKKK